MDQNLDIALRTRSDATSFSEDAGPVADDAGPGEAAFTDLLRTIVEGTVSAIGEDFFRQLVKCAGIALGVRFAFVAEFAGSRSRVRTLAFWSRDGFLDNVEYDLDGSPCEAVLAGEAKLFSHDVANLFPKERKELMLMGAESYFAIPLLDNDAKVLGHLAVIDDKPMRFDARNASVFSIFGARVAAELERRRAEHALLMNEKRLANILGSTLDAIITLDEDRAITLFNNSAERLLGCRQAEALGKDFDRFLSKPFRRLLDNYLKSLDHDHASKQVWAPEGLTALRANGVEFPVELTISHSQLGPRNFFTLVLRDLDERQAADRYVQRLERENRYLLDEMAGGRPAQDIVTQSGKMHAVFDAMSQVAGTGSTILVLGETGVGKELIAQSVHSLSGRRDKPFIKLNCAALPAELIESELFGHEKGAFTGALAQRIGRFELAHGGTLFLDEVGELSASAQAKLLRVLQDSRFERIGGAKTIQVDVRLIAATNRDLKAMMQAGQFRTDLFYRLNVFPIWIPPLRERREDIPLLARHFLRLFCRQLNKRIDGLAPRAQSYLERYDWPGNIRELRNVIERAVILCPGIELEIDEAAFQLVPHAPPSGRDGRTLAGAERRHIESTLAERRWVIEGSAGAAAALNLKPSTLRSKMRKLGIRKPD